MEPLPTERKAQALRPLINRLMGVMGLLTCAIGLGGLLGILLNIPLLRSYIPHETPLLALPSAIALFFLGIATICLSHRTPSGTDPRWFFPVKLGSLIIPGLIGFSLILTHLSQAGFNAITLLSQASSNLPSFAGAFCILLSTLSLLTFLTHPHSEKMMVYGIGIPMLYIFNLALFTVVGHWVRLPLLYGFNLSPPETLAFILISLGGVIGAIPYRGIAQPILSDGWRNKFLSYVGFFTGIAILVIGSYTISQYEANLSIARTGASGTIILKELYIITVLLTIALVIFIKMTTLRAVHFLNVASFHAEQQEKRARQESVIRSITQTIHQTLDLEEVFQSIADALGSYLKADRCFIAYFDCKSRELIPPIKEYRASDDIQSMMTIDPELWATSKSHFSEHICQQPCPVEFTRQAVGTKAEFRSILEKTDIQSGIGCSIDHQDQCMAILYVHQSRR
jgi:hypothetical protein